MFVMTPEKENEFRNRALYKLTPMINPAELPIIKLNGSFNLLINACTIGMVDVYAEMMEKVEDLEDQIDEYKFRIKKLEKELSLYVDSSTIDSSIVDSSLEEKEHECLIIPLWPDGAPPAPLV